MLVALLTFISRSQEARALSALACEVVVSLSLASSDKLDPRILRPARKLTLAPKTPSSGVYITKPNKVVSSPIYVRAYMCLYIYPVTPDSISNSR